MLQLGSVLPLNAGPNFKIPIPLEEEEGCPGP